MASFFEFLSTKSAQKALAGPIIVEDTFPMCHAVLLNP